jgi:hypothetical protein
MFCSPSTPSTDSLHSVYFPTTDFSSDIFGNQPPKTVPLLIMENDHITSLEQALSELQAQDVNTQSKLDTLIQHITSLKTIEPSKI